MSFQIEGGCSCGSCRFSTPNEAVYQLLCYCTDCQAISGSTSYTAYVVPLVSVAITKGVPTKYVVDADSGRTNARMFCPDCGTQLYAELEELGVASVDAMALDDPLHYRPTLNHYTKSAPDWCQVNAKLDELPLIPR